MPFSYAVMSSKTLNVVSAPPDHRGRAERAERLDGEGRHARRFHGVMRAVAGDLLRFLDRIRLLAVHNVRRPEVFRQPQAVLVDVDCDDLRAADDVRRHDNTQSHCAATEYDERFTELRPQCVEDSAGYCAALKPPSMGNIWPEIARPCGPARNSANAAISSGSTNLWIA